MMIFTIGLSKTGTSSVHRALQKLGYNSIHYPSIKKYKSFYKKLQESKANLDGLENYNAFSDIPFAFIFEKFEEKYPESKFIYTKRDMSSWLTSCSKNMQTAPNNILSDIRFLTYSTRIFNKKKMKIAYENHEKKVLNHFKDKQNLLVLDIVGGDGWEPLCAFLNKSVPNEPFPHENKTK